MSSFPILDLVAGMIFIFFLLSIINNSLLEIIYSFTKARAAMFRNWLQSVFSAEVNNPAAQNRIPLWQAIVDHSSTNALSAPKKATNYLSATDFSTALMDLLTANPRDEKHKDVPLPAAEAPAANEKVSGNDSKAIMDALPITIENIEFALNNNLEILPESMRRIFLFYVSQAKNAPAEMTKKMTPVQIFSQQMEGWFDRVMQLLAGRFKKFTLWYTFAAATIITVCLNIDSVDMMHYLYDHSAEATALANAGNAAAYDSTTNSMMNNINRVQVQLNNRPKDSLMMKSYATSVDKIISDAQAKMAHNKNASDTVAVQMPIGWNSSLLNAFGKQHNCTSRISIYFLWAGYHFFGYLLTILAICLGAPFWFDVLGKVANLRSSVKPLSTATDDQTKGS